MSLITEEIVKVECPYCKTRMPVPITEKPVYPQCPQCMHALKVGLDVTVFDVDEKGLREYAPSRPKKTPLSVSTPLWQLLDKNDAN